MIISFCIIKEEKEKNQKKEKLIKLKRFAFYEFVFGIL